MNSSDIVIVSAKRTPIGAFNGGLASIPSHQLGALAINAALNAITLDPALIDETIMGQVLTAGEGMNPARQAARRAGIADAASAFTVNQVCGSGLRAVTLGLQQIHSGVAKVIVCGGQESMSRAPHLIRLRNPHKLGDATLIDSMQFDGLQDAFHTYPMGVTAENLASKFGIGREAQDVFALHSQAKASEATHTGRFAQELVPVKVSAGKSEQVVSTDEHIRHGITLDQLNRLKPAFNTNGTVTAGNASGINDGAAALVLVSSPVLHSMALKPLAVIKAWACAGVDPAFMGEGPVPASRLALQRAGWSVNDVQLWEINEAFAVQTLVVMRELGIDPATVNVNGGAIALGHPVGASGARVLVTLIHALQQRQLRRGVATLCIGGGMGIALCIERA